MEFLKWSYLVSGKQGFSSRVRLLCLWNWEIGMSQKKQQCMVLMGQSYELRIVVLHIKDTFGQAQKQTPQESHSSLRNLCTSTSSSSSEGFPGPWAVLYTVHSVQCPSVERRPGVGVSSVGGASQMSISLPPTPEPTAYCLQATRN